MRKCFLIVAVLMSAVLSLRIAVHCFQEAMELYFTQEIEKDIEKKSAEWQVEKARMEMLDEQ